MSAQEVTRTYDCKFANCTNEARSPVGRYSYCSEHQNRGATVKALPRASAQTGAVTESLQQLSKIAKDVDRLHAKAKRLTEQALAAKREADAKGAEFRAQARALIGSEVE